MSLRHAPGLCQRAGAVAERQVGGRELKTSWRHGTAHILMLKLKFMQCARRAPAASTAAFSDDRFEALYLADHATAPGRYRTSPRQGSGQRFAGYDGIGFLRLQYLVQLTSALTAAAKPNGCLMSVSVSSPSEGQRPEPLQCGQRPEPERKSTPALCRTELRFRRSDHATCNGITFEPAAKVSTRSARYCSALFRSAASSMWL